MTEIDKEVEIEESDQSSDSYIGDELYSQLKDALIMMVDDEPIIMDILQTFLEERGYQNFTRLSILVRRLK